MHELGEKRHSSIKFSWEDFGAPLRRNDRRNNDRRRPQHRRMDLTYAEWAPNFAHSRSSQKVGCTCCPAERGACCPRGAASSLGRGLSKAVPDCPPVRARSGARGRGVAATLPRVVAAASSRPCRATAATIPRRDRAATATPRRRCCYQHAAHIATAVGGTSCCCLWFVLTIVFLSLKLHLGTGLSVIVFMPFFALVAILGCVCLCACVPPDSPPRRSEAELAPVAAAVEENGGRLRKKMDSPSKDRALLEIDATPESYVPPMAAVVGGGAAGLAVAGAVAAGAVAVEDEEKTEAWDGAALVEALRASSGSKAAVVARHCASRAAAPTPDDLALVFGSLPASKAKPGSISALSPSEGRTRNRADPLSLRGHALEPALAARGSRRTQVALALLRGPRRRGRARAADENHRGRRDRRRERRRLHRARRRGDTPRRRLVGGRQARARRRRAEPVDSAAEARARVSLHSPLVCRAGSHRGGVAGPPWGRGTHPAGGIHAPAECHYFPEACDTRGRTRGRTRLERSGGIGEPTVHKAPLAALPLLAKMSRPLEAQIIALVLATRARPRGTPRSARRRPWADTTSSSWLVVVDLGRPRKIRVAATPPRGTPRVSRDRRKPRARLAEPHGKHGRRRRRARREETARRHGRRRRREHARRRPRRA